MARHFRYATHAQVLAEHPGLAWTAAVDPAAGAREALRGAYPGVPVYAAAGEIPEPLDIAVLATPPGGRIEILESLRSLRAVLCEKPVGDSAGGADRFAAYCRDRRLVVQVNLIRRADVLMNDLRAGRLREIVGEVQAVFSVYGNGIRNNGVHMVDLVRMLCGEIDAPRAVASFPEHPAAHPGDRAVAFGALLRGGRAAAFFAPVDFDLYRENSIEIWGRSGRLLIAQEGLLNAVFPLRPNRGVDAAMEIASDAPTLLPPTVGNALYRMYDNLVEVLDGRGELVSSIENAQRSERVIDEVLASA